MRTNHIIKLFLILVFALGSFARLSAQPNTLYFLKGVAQTKEINPARPGISAGYYLSMPLFSALDLSLNANNWSYSNLIHKGSGVQSDSLVWDFNKFLSGLGSTNFINESAALTLLDFGWKNKQQFFGFSISEHEFAEAFFKKDLIDLMVKGNYPSLGGTINTGYFGVGAQHYRQFAFTYSKELNKKMTFGFTAKMLFGIGAIKTSGLSLMAGQPGSGDQISMNATGRIQFSAPVVVQFVQNNGFTSRMYNYYDANTYFSNFGNPGFAVDLGYSKKVNDNLTFSASLVDLGFINWKTNLSTMNERGHFVYRGINLDDPTFSPPTNTEVRKLVNAVRDSMIAAFLPDTAASKFTTILPVKLYIAEEYKVNDQLTFAGLARFRIFNNMIHTSLTASVNSYISKNLSLSASYSVMESTYDNLGLGAAFRIGAMQFYAVTDNALSLFHPSEAKNTNLRVGINLIFQDEGKFRKIPHRRSASRRSLFRR